MRFFVRALLSDKLIIRVHFRVTLNLQLEAEYVIERLVDIHLEGCEFCIRSRRAGRADALCDELTLAASRDIGADLEVCKSVWRIVEDKELCRGTLARDESVFARLDACEGGTEGIPYRIVCGLRLAGPIYKAVSCGAGPGLVEIPVDSH